MIMTKRIFALLLAGLMLLTTACGGGGKISFDETETAEPGRLSRRSPQGGGGLNDANCN